jgi:protein-disulfide isomerase
MTRNAMPTLEPLEEAIDHVRGPTAGRLIVDYGDCECPYSRQAFREIERVEQSLTGAICFAFRHFPLTEIHPHALSAALQGRFWDMHELLFHRQRALEDGDLRRYAAGIGLNVALFNSDQGGAAVLGRVHRDVESGVASGEVRGTPTLFIDGIVNRGGDDAATLMGALAR